MVRAALAKEEKPDLISIELDIARELADAEHHILHQAEQISIATDILKNLESPEQ